jgi:tetratricopeptide (TPR) repeat protein
MTRNEFAEAERQLERADRAAPGFPEINQARAELSRRRIVAERQQDEMRLLIAAIEASFQRRQYDDAERAIADGRRRYAGYPVWDELQGRSVAARRGDDRQGAEQRARTVKAMELVTAARRSTTQGDFAAAERALTEANTLAPRMPEIAAANAELERAKADRARQVTEIKAMQVLIDAALQRKQYADAERLLADATKRYPTEASWAPRSARLAEERRATPGQTGNAPMPAPAPATPPAQPPVAAAPPPGTPAPPVTPPAAAPKPDPSKPVADAKAAIARGDFPAAETAVSAAEKIDAKAPTVIAVRKELNIARLVATARNNIRRQNFEAAEKAVADAEKIDAKDATVVKVRAELTAAESAPQQQRPNRRRD